MDTMGKGAIQGFISALICIPLILLMFLSISYIGFDTIVARSIDVGIFFAVVFICSAIACIEWKV